MIPQMALPGSNPVLATISLSLVALLSGASNETWTIPSLAEVAASDPDRAVEVTVRFQTIQRTSAIVELLEGSRLKLTEVQHKNVGSGGGSAAIFPFESIIDGLRRAEDTMKYTNLTRLLSARTGKTLFPPPMSPGMGGGPRSRFPPSATLSVGGATGRSVSREELDAIALPPCDVDDATAPVMDTNGIPGDPEMEAACGLRIHAIKLSGTARECQELADRLAGAASIERLATTNEILEIRRRLIERAQDSPSQAAP